MTYQYFSEVRRSFEKCAKNTAAPRGRTIEKSAFTRSILRNVFDPANYRKTKATGKLVTDIAIPGVAASTIYAGDESKVPGTKAVLDALGLSGGGLRGRLKTENIPGTNQQRPQTIDGMGKTPTGARTGLSPELALGLSIGSGAISNPRMLSQVAGAGLREIKHPSSPAGILGKSTGTDALSGAMKQFWPSFKQKALFSAAGGVAPAVHMFGDTERATSGMGDAAQSTADAAAEIRNMVKQVRPGVQAATEKVTDVAGNVADSTQESVDLAKTTIQDLHDTAQTVKKETPRVFKDVSDAGADVREGMFSVSDAVGQGVDMVREGGRAIAPVGAGALGGYVLANLLGKKVPKREAQHEREKRERHQRLINLLGAAGGGALGLFLKNKFDPMAPANPETTTTT